MAEVVTCRQCEGVGSVPSFPHSERCDSCNGRGWESFVSRVPELEAQIVRLKTALVSVGVHPDLVELIAKGGGK